MTTYTYMLNIIYLVLYIGCNKVYDILSLLNVFRRNSTSIDYFVHTSRRICINLWTIHNNSSIHLNIYFNAYYSSVLLLCHSSNKYCLFISYLFYFYVFYYYVIHLINIVYLLLIYSIFIYYALFVHFIQGNPSVGCCSQRAERLQERIWIRQ